MLSQGPLVLAMNMKEKKKQEAFKEMHSTVIHEKNKMSLFTSI